MEDVRLVLSAAVNVRDKLIAAGVKNLRKFGYPSCNADNILTDQVYSVFFASILKDNLGKGFDKEVKALLKEVEK